MDPVGVANLALGWLGAGILTSLDDPGTTAELFKTNFDPLRNAVLEARDWTFATERRQLTAEPVAPLFGYGSRFLIPADVLRLITVELPSGAGVIDAFAASIYGSDDGGLDWVREGPYILAEGAAAAVNIRAIIEVPDSARWSPTFCQCLAARLAADLAIPVTQDRSLAADLWKLYEAKLKDAAANDGRQGRSQVIRATALSRRR